jgi:hypothetical protein
MKSTTLNTEEASSKWWAARDRAVKNAVNKSNFTEKEQLRAVRMQTFLQEVYRGTVYSPSYGIKGISIKVQQGAVLGDRKALRSIEDDWTSQGVVKRITPQGTIYRIPKQ